METEEKRKEGERNDFGYKRMSGLEGMKMEGKYSFNFYICRLVYVRTRIANDLKVHSRFKYVKSTFRIVLKTKPISSLSHVMTSYLPHSRDQ